MQIKYEVEKGTKLHIEFKVYQAKTGRMWLQVNDLKKPLTEKNLSQIGLSPCDFICDDLNIFDMDRFIKCYGED